MHNNGLIADELDFPRSEVGTAEDTAVQKSVKYLNKLITEILSGTKYYVTYIDIY